MAAYMRKCLRYASWLLPHGVHLFRHQMLSKLATKSLLPRSELATNARLKNKHCGQRCFILGNGPSVKYFDLTSLQGEIVFSVSNGYLHKGYSELAPVYHCVPQITYGKIDESSAKAWFEEMHSNIGSSELFLNETEAALVKKFNLFPGRKVHYLALQKSFDEVNCNDIIDIARPAPRIQSVPVMTLMIAMYMGFREIILIGIDHDELLRRKYLYAFELRVQKGKDFSVDDEGNSVTSLYDDLQAYARLWRQYRVLRTIARHHSIEIINANPDSWLDEFPKINFWDVANID